MAASKPQFNQIKLKTDYQRIAQKGRRRIVAPWLSASTVVTNKPIRIGWALPRATGTAVTRNKIKRWLREYGKTADQLKNKTGDVVFFFRVPKELNDLRKIERNDVFNSLNKFFS